MAVLASKATGNFLTASTWGLVDSTSYLNAENGSEILTTAYSGTRSSAFTPGAIEIDGIAVKLSVRTGTTGTISVNLELDSDNSQVAGTEVTINCSDLPIAATTDANGGWVFFKFAAPVTLLAATAYQVAAKTSNASQVSLFRDGTADNIARFLRTTTNQAPVAGDDLIVLGEHTGAGTGNDLTVTMNETAATDYGAASTSLVLPALAICKRGTLQYGTTAATNYILRLSGHAIVYSAGTLNIGTTGTPIPRDSSAVLEFDCAADGDFGLTRRAEGIIVAQGLSRTSGKNVVMAYLNTDEAVNSTSLGVDTDTGWLDNDQIVVASTTRTATQSELGALNGNAGASSLTVDGFGGAGGGLANAHSGTSPTQAEVGLLTRNVRVRAVSSTAMAFINVRGAGTLDFDWVEFYYLGENATDKRGIELTAATSFNMNFCSLHDVEDGGIVMSGNYNNVVISDNILYNLSTSLVSQLCLNVGSTTGTVITITDNLFVTMNCASGNTSMVVSELVTNFSGNTIVGAGNGSTSTGLAFSESDVFCDTFNDNTFHSCPGLPMSNNATGIMLEADNLKIWRNGGPGLNLILSGGYRGTFVFTNCLLFGNTTANVDISDVVPYVVFKNCTFDSDASFSTTSNFRLTGTANMINMFLIGCSLSPTVAATNDILFNSALTAFITAINSTFGGTTEIGTPSNMSPSSFFRSQKHDGSLDNTKTITKYGTVAAETTVRHTASGYSWKMTPNNASNKLRLLGPTEFDTLKVAVGASSQVDISVWVRKDGSYNGNAPRLVLVGGMISGIASDVTDSLTVGADTWEELTVSGTPSDAGVVEFYVDCDGTAGNVYVDDVTPSQ